MEKVLKIVRISRNTVSVDIPVRSSDVNNRRSLEERYRFYKERVGERDRAGVRDASVSGKTNAGWGFTRD
jgi:hypothetical protein